MNILPGIDITLNDETGETNSAARATRARLVRLFRQVWASIPERDRDRIAVLWKPGATVRICYEWNNRGDGTVAAAQRDGRGLLFLSVFISTTRTDRPFASDAAVRSIIAHEIGHCAVTALRDQAEADGDDLLRLAIGRTRGEELNVRKIAGAWGYPHEDFSGWCCRNRDRMSWLTRDTDDRCAETDAPVGYRKEDYQAPLATVDEHKHNGRCSPDDGGAWHCTPAPPSCASEPAAVKPEPEPSAEPATGPPPCLNCNCPDMRLLAGTLDRFECDHCGLRRAWRSNRHSSIGQALGERRRARPQRNRPVFDLPAWDRADRAAVQEALR